MSQGGGMLYLNVKVDDLLTHQLTVQLLAFGLEAAERVAARAAAHTHLRQAGCHGGLSDRHTLFCQTRQLYVLSMA
jgi:hypothetical protein